MSLEHFPVKEKLATNLGSQIAWLAREMGYSRDKPIVNNQLIDAEVKQQLLVKDPTAGYEEKLVRLRRNPEDGQSVFGFMNSYWGRFNKADANLQEFPEPVIVSRALQANAKVVAGLSDKIAFALWLQGKADGMVRDPEWLLDTALDSVIRRVEQLKGHQTDEELLSYIGKPFEENPMGAAVLKLHESFSRDANDIELLHDIALEGAAAGVLMWQAYGRSLEHQSFSVEMPMPGESSGNIEPWV